MDHPFSVGGPTYLIATTATQIPPGTGQSFRIVNPNAALQYIAWGLTNAVTVTAPGAGTPQANTIAIPASGERTVVIPTQGLFFIVSPTSLLVTQGDGV